MTLTRWLIKVLSSLIKRHNLSPHQYSGRDSWLIMIKCKAASPEAPCVVFGLIWGFPAQRHSFSVGFRGNFLFFLCKITQDVNIQKTHNKHCARMWGLNCEENVSVAESSQGIMVTLIYIAGSILQRYNSNNDRGTHRNVEQDLVTQDHVFCEGQCWIRFWEINFI